MLTEICYFLQVFFTPYGGMDKYKIHIMSSKWNNADTMGILQYKKIDANKFMYLADHNHAEPRAISGYFFHFLGADGPITYPDLLYCSQEFCYSNYHNGGCRPFLDRVFRHVESYNGSHVGLAYDYCL